MNDTQRITAPADNYLRGLTTKKMIDEQIQLVDRGCSLYYVMMGGIYNVMNSAMVDAMFLVKQNKRFYRQRIKQDFNMAVKCFNDWITKMKLKLGDRFQLWLDVSDKIDDELRMDVKKLTFAFDNWLLKNGEPDNKLKASLQTVITLIDISDVTCDKMFKSIQKNISCDIRPLFKGATMANVKFYWNRACEPILKCEDNKKVINFNDSPDCDLAVKVLIQKISNENLYNDASNYALQLNPDQWKYLSKEERMLVKKGTPLTVDNESEEPTEQQINNLKTKFAS